MRNAVFSEALIAAFAAMVAITIMRKHTPRAIELLLWTGLIWVCLLGVTGIRDQQARDLTSAAFWGASQVLGSVIQLGVVSLGLWLIDNRFVFADWAVLIAGTDLLILAFLASRRQANGWKPRIRLRDWMEMPRRAEPKPAPVTASAVDELNERFNVWAPVAAAAALTWTTLMLIWTGDVAEPRIRQAGEKAGATAGGARRRLAGVNWRAAVARVSARPRRLTEQVVDIEDLSRRAADMRSRAATWLADAGRTPEVNWLGGFGVMPPDDLDGGDDPDDKQRDRRDQLAS
jgi:hypothetical protein